MFVGWLVGFVWFCLVLFCFVLFRFVFVLFLFVLPVWLNRFCLFVEIMDDQSSLPFKMNVLFVPKQHRRKQHRLRVWRASKVRDFSM